MPAIPVENATILITGANRGIGKAIVDSVIAAGAAKVYAAVRKPDSAQPLIEQYGDQVVAVALDVSDTASVNAAAEVASDVQIVINNAGVLRTSSPLAESAYGDLDFEIDVNVKGLLRVAQAFAPVLKANGGGALANLNSVASFKSFSDFATYAASKAAAYSITQGLRDKLADQGTRVLSVHPGPIATDMADDAGIGEMAEPASQVGEAIVAALADADTFHVYTDTMAREIGAAYQSFAAAVIEG